MSQQTPVIDNIVGADYRARCNESRQALMTHHKGGAAPDYAETGMIWCDDSATPWLLKFYDGADWITMGAIDAGTNLFTPFYAGSEIGLSTTAASGLAQRATDAIAMGGANTNRFVSPKHLADYVAANATGGKILIAEAVASDSATVEFLAGLTGDYDYYTLELIDVKGAANAPLNMRVSTDGGTTWASGAADYDVVQSFQRVDDATPAGNGFSTSSIKVGTGWAFEAGEVMQAVVEIFSPANANSKKYFKSCIMGERSVSNDLAIGENYSRYVGSTSAVNALQFFMGTGNITSGTFRLYGHKTA